MSTGEPYCLKCGPGKECQCCAGWKEGAPASAMVPRFAEVSWSRISAIHELIAKQREWLSTHSTDISSDKELYLRGALLSLHMTIGTVLGERFYKNEVFEPSTTGIADDFNKLINKIKSNRGEGTK